MLTRYETIVVEYMTVVSVRYQYIILRKMYPL